MTNRRSFLAAAGTIGALPLAGCLSDSNILDGDDEETESDDEADTDDETEENSEDDNESEDDRDAEGDATDGGDDDEEGTEDEGADEREDEEDEGDDEENEGDGEEESDELADLPGETVDDFEDVDAWGPIVGQEEIAGEEEDVYAGTTSGRITAPEEEESAMVFRRFSDGLDLSDRGISLAIKYTGREQFDLSVQLLATNERDRLDFRRVLTGAKDRWQRVDLGVNAIEGDPDLENVREIRITGRRRGNDEGELDFLVDDLRAAPRPGTGAVMLLFDGVLDSHYSTAFSLLEEFGFPGVEAVMPEALGNDGRLTIDDLEEMSDAGWDMISRPRTGAQFLDEYTPEQQEGLVRRTKGFLENRGFEDGARHFLTPRNVLTPETHDLVREYHEQAFRYGGTPNGLPLTDPHNLGHFSGTGGDTTEHFVEMAAAYNQLAVLHFTDIGGDEIDDDEFEDLLEFIDESNVEVVTASDLLDTEFEELTAEGGGQTNEENNESSGNQTDNESGENETDDGS